MMTTGGGRSSADVRAHNLGLVLTFLERSGPASRTTIAEATGLVRGAITALISELLELRLVRPTVAEADGSSDPQKGRPRELLELDGSDRVVLAIEFRPGLLLIRATDLAGRPLLERDVPVQLPHADPERVADLLAEQYTEAVRGLPDVRVLQLVLVAPAPVRAADRVIPIAVDFGWRDVNLVRLVSERIAPPVLGVSLVNDANAASYAEFAALLPERRATGSDDVLYVKSDTGIGGGAIIAGQVLSGANGFAFEPGHVIVEPGGEPCDCGKSGCLVTVAGPDLVLAGAGLAPLVERSGTQVALSELVRRYREGETAVVRAVDDAARWFRLVLTNAVMLFQPGFIVLGGYLAEFVDELSDLPASGLAQQGDDPLRQGAVIRGSVYGASSSIVGALMIARHDLLAAPSVLRDLN